MRAVSERVVRGYFEAAGVEPGGSRPSDPRIHNPRFYRRVLLDGSLGLGESYVEGWWDCERLDELVARLARLDVARSNTGRPLGRLPLGAAVELRSALSSRVLNRQRRRRAAADVTAHYDRDGELFRAMLDRRQMYTCARWDDARSLDEAQERKLDLVCRKLALRPGMRVLDIGCGWGGFAIYAAEHHGVEVVGITLSPSQAQVARQRAAGLPVEIRVQDYREVEGRFDRIASLGMLEHVGYKNYPTYMRTLDRCLSDDGLALVQVIGNVRSTTHIDAWLDRYIFPGAMLPSIAQLGAAMEPRLVMEDWHNFGVDYDRTLCAWHANVEGWWPARYDQRFRRLWRFYLLACAGLFRARRTQLWQLVLSRGGLRGGYRSIR